MQPSTDPSPLPPRCANVAGLLAARALGVELAADERDQLLDHLFACAACRERLDGYSAVAAHLPLAVPEAVPSPELRERLLASAAAGRVPRTAPPDPVTPAPRRVNWRRLLASGLSLGLALALGFGVSRELAVRGLQDQLGAQQAQTQLNGRTVIAAFGNDDALEVTLGPGPAAPAATGRVFISPGEPAVAVYARGLPQLEAGQQYQVWVETDAGVISAGVLPVNAEGRGWRPLRPAAPLQAVTRVFVTAAPVGGSVQPVGEVYLDGTP